MTIGPVQIVVLGFEGGSFEGEILEELRRLRDHDVIRLIDLLFVSKDADGTVTIAEASDPLEDGDVFEPDQVWYVTDSIPNGTSAAIALLEHRWAIPMRDAVGRAGGALLAESWVHPLDLVAVGLAEAGEIPGTS